MDVKTCLAFASLLMGAAVNAGVVVRAPSPVEAVAPAATSTILACPAVCRTVKPVCTQAGWAPTGSEGCWGCCRPILL